MELKFEFQNIAPYMACIQQNIIRNGYHIYYKTKVFNMSWNGGFFLTIQIEYNFEIPYNVCEKYRI